MISWISSEEEDRQWNEFVLGCFENSVDGDLALWRSHKSGRVQLSMIDRTASSMREERSHGNQRREGSDILDGCHSPNILIL